MKADLMQRLTIALQILTYTVNVFAEIDLKRYNEGRDQYELIHQQSQMPRYGQCWRDSMVLLQQGCGKLTDEIQTRLALAYLSCFLQVQGRDALKCDSDDNIKDCTSHIKDGDRSSLSTFFTHTQNMCYFLQAQVWHEETEKTVSRLADSSSQVVSHLEASHKLQEDILTSQNHSLHNQELLMHQAYNLKDVINSSSDSVKMLFEDLKHSTREQGQIMGELFDQLKALRNTIFGEVFGFYSFIYHFMSILVSYVLTSTSRTSGARFWLFIVVIINVIVEQTLLKFIALTLWPSLSSDGKVNDELLYWLQKQIRRLTLLVGLFILAITVYMYQDIQTLNNKLLTEIRKQNSDIKRFLTGSKNQSGEGNTNTVKEKKGEFSDSDYTSDNDDGAADLSDAESDKTFILEQENEMSEAESVLVEEDRSSLMNELIDLKRSTPIREIEESVKKWVGQSDPARQDLSSNQHSYNLRRRQATPSPNTSPALRVESARSFSKTVEHLQRISEKNSRLAREYLKDKPASSPGPSSSNGNVNKEFLLPSVAPSVCHYMTRQRSATPDSLSASSRASTLRLSQGRKN